MAYGQSPTLGPVQLQRVFSDAMRTQLDRILADQISSPAAGAQHAATNAIAAEAWDYMARSGPQALWTLEDDERLFTGGWKPAEVSAVAKFIVTSIRQV